MDRSPEAASSHFSRQLFCMSRNSRPFIALAAPIATVLIGFCSLASAQTADRPVNLLRLPKAKVERTSLVGKDAAHVPRLTDGDLATAARIPATPPATFDIVYSFDQTVAPTSVLVKLPAATADDPLPVRMELLA